MISLLRRFVGLLLLLLLAACQPASPPTANPGVSLPLTYPVLLIGQNDLEVRDTEEELITIFGHSSLNLVERVILDSDGRLFEVVDSVPEPGGKSWWQDLGNRSRRYEVTVKERRKQDWPKIRQLLLEQVNSPNSVWSGDARAVAKVESLTSPAEAIEACRTPWEWMR